MKEISIGKRLALYFIIFVGSTLISADSTSYVSLIATLAVVIAAFLLGYAVCQNESCKKHVKHVGRGSGRGL